MKKNALLLFILSAIAFAGCGQAQVAKQVKDDTELRKEIGQMLIVGFRGTDISDTSHIVRDIKDYNIGGVILFEYDVPSQSRPRNISSKQQLKQLCAKLQKRGGGNLLISIDQEGGKVSRLKEKYGFPTFDSPEKTASEGDKSVRQCAQLTAQTLKEVGINLDFAPCVDVNVNPNCPVIGKLERSFSANPKRVAECAEIWIDELHKNGVTACLKHFPGHGSSKADTHLGLADVSDTWQTKELDPYKKLIGLNKVRMIMTTHVFNAQIDSVYPATLSHSTLTGLLRDSLHYDGVIITDDLAMGAMTQHYTYEEMLLKTILAGADMLCISNNGKEYNADIVPQTVDLIYKMVKSGKIPAERIHESAERVKKLKKHIINK
ncbi:MAG: glycoside hydrolase family 3 protein [Bacteroidales bacterium]|nr:glycoside hydrolase family 3 protein [Bacteroidales bacterium]